MIDVHIEPAKQRFGRKPRKQWKFRISSTNNRQFSDRDTYANPADIIAMLQKIRWDSVRVHVHYEDRVSTHDIPASPPF